MTRYCAGFRRRTFVFVAAAAWLAPGSSTRAANDVWKTAASGTWSAGLNWVDGSSPSSIFDQATFNLAGAYTVSFTVDPDPIGALTVTNAANVTFASSSRPGNPIVPRSLSLVETSGANTGDLIVSGGATLTLGATTGGFPSSSHPFHLTTGNDITLFNATLNVRFGSDVNAASLTQAGQLNVTGTGSSVTVTQFFDSGTAEVTLGGLIQSGSGINAGVVTISGPGSRWINSGSLQIGISDSFVGGLNGTLSVTGGGFVENLNATLGDQLGLFSATGTVTVTDSGSLWKTTNLLQIGGVRPGTFNVQPGGTVSVGQETVIGSQGRLRMQGGTFDTGEFSIEGDGQFEWNSGTFRVGTYHGDLVNHSGTLAPGHSAGSTMILGTYTQQAAGTLQIEIGGTAQNTQYDVVNVTGNAVLGGDLELMLINGFIPIASQTFVIFNTSTSMSGAFQNVANGQRLTTSEGGGSFLVHYGAGSAFDPALVVLSSFQSVSLPGDYNQNGIVDAADYTVWRNGGSPDDTTAGYNLWRTNFGRTSGTGTAVAIPEPTSWLLLAIACAASLVRLCR